MATSSLDALEEHINCSVCLEVLRNPHALRCLHTYCYKCIQQLKQQDKVICPDCRQTTQITEIKKEFKIQSFIDLYNKSTGSAPDSEKEVDQISSCLPKCTTDPKYPVSTREAGLYTSGDFKQHGNNLHVVGGSSPQHGDMCDDMCGSGGKESLTSAENAEVIFVSFNKVRNSMGLSIVAAKGEGQEDRGIYIKAVVPGGAAAQDGRLQPGDQILEVDGINLTGLTQAKAAVHMTNTGQCVKLKVFKQGAVHHGLAVMLS